MALRLKLEPDMRRAKNGLAVLGADLRFVNFGPGKTEAKKDSPTPATITFCGAYVTKAREEVDPDLEPFAKVTGSLNLTGPTRVAVMELESEAIEHDEPEPDDDNEAPRPYQLRMGFDPGSFQYPAAAQEALSVLRLPEAPDGARYFELGVELEIDGTKEAEAGANDRLDVTLSSITFFATRLADDDDFPIDEERFVLELFDGSSIEGTTDAEGGVYVNPIPAGRCILTLPEVPEGPLSNGSEEETDA